jgi:hypothetical protein
VLPDYEGGGISSLVPEIYHRLGAPIKGQVRLSEKALPGDVFKGVKRIVLIVLDGLGYNTLMRFSKRTSPHLLDRALSYNRITSVTPSTTSSVLCTLSTGVPPALHGIVGYRLLLPKERELVDIIAFKRAYSDKLLDIDPYAQMLAPPAFHLLSRRGVSYCLLTRDRYARSPYSRMIYRGCEVQSYFDFSDLCVRARRLIASNRFTYIYWDVLDTLGHIYGMGTEESRTEIDHLDRLISEELIEKGSPKGTLFLITADHGHIDTDPAHRVRFNDHPELLRLLRVLPGGDSRLPYLYVKRGKVEQAMDYLRANPAGISAVVDRGYAIRSGLFGAAKMSREAEGRIGDIIIIPKDNWKFVYFYKEGQRDLVGRHGGLSSDEMYVPLIAIRT